MPIIVGDKPIFRIKFKDADIREVRHGNDLQWGLYKITYKNGGPKTIPVAAQVDRYNGNTAVNDPEYPESYQTDSSKQKNISWYVWGYPNQSNKDFYLYIPGTKNGKDDGDDAHKWTQVTAASSPTGYKMYCDGWFDNNSCSNDAYLSYIPATENDFHKDLTLYCKWRQRRYLYNGIGVYFKTSTIISGYEWVVDD